MMPRIDWFVLFERGVRSCRIALGVATSVLIFAPTIGAQDTTTVPGVRLGLNYEAGTKPGVIVLPVHDEFDDDSLRVIIQRDLDYGDRMNVIALDEGTLSGLVPAPGQKINFALVAKFGAALLVRITPTTSGMHVAAYDVSRGQLLQSEHFLFDRRDRDWRFAVHGMSDQIEQWVFGKRGIAQTRIAYVNNGMLRIVDSDGSETRSITTGKGALSPAWSPTGESVVFTVLGNNGTQVHELDVRTGRTRRISQIGAGLNITPIYQPNGSGILYAQGTGHGTDLIFASLEDSSESRRITAGRGTDNTSPSYSPDGRQIAFISGKSGQPQVYIMDADGSNVQLLTPYTVGKRSYRASPDWSPDGRAIAYEQQSGNFQIWMIDLRDRTPKQLTSEGENEDPSWAPDGRHIVFSSTRSGDKQLWVLDTETGRSRQLTHSRGARLAAWSPILANPEVGTYSQ
jgi:TolB protein